MRMGPRQAEAMVKAFLGRPPQDELEAAVVLESWGGVSGPHALRTAAEMSFPPSAAGTRAGRREQPEPDGSGLAESLATLALVLAMFVLAAGAGPNGSEAAADAWRPAVPVTMGATWLLRRRYGAGRTAVGLLRSDAGLLLAGTAALTAAPLVLLPGAGGMVAAFIVLGVAGAVTVLRGWGALSAATLVAIAAVAPDAASVTATFAGAAAVVALIAAVAIATAPASRTRTRPWRRAAPAGIAGATTGLLIALVASGVDRADTWVVAVALLPSLVASLVGGLRLSRFWVLVPAALAATSLITGRGGAAAARRVAHRLVAGAWALALAVMATLSVAAHTVADAAGQGSAATALLVGFGAAAAVALAVTLLEAFARSWWAVGTAATACAGYAGATTALPDAGAAVAATAVALLLAALPLSALLRRPERTLATLA